MIAYQKKLIRIAEYWDNEPVRNPRVDLVRLFQQSKPVADSSCRDFYSILLDLQQDEKALLSNMKRNTRYEIRRAATSDHLTYYLDDRGDLRTLNEFCDDYDRFADRKAQPKINRPWVSLLAGSRLLRLSQIRDVNGDTMVWHAYHVGVGRATLLFSSSTLRPDDSPAARSRTGRANRYHHWQDILYFKQQGIAIYDFGGWYEKKEDQERLRINQFKESFGGEIIKNYICEQPLTLRGRVFLKTRKLVLGNAI
jgi:hypothetical protein